MENLKNSPEYCIHTLVMNTYCVNKRGFFVFYFYLFLPLFLRGVRPLRKYARAYLGNWCPRIFLNIFCYK